ncbi:helix-turn-helix domain-containing protein [Butyrivibrio sp. INlla16]|uniref:helix-turn-helix domain-containing protein n=1 Tax=Butyrivibrio sp. INlla16 TaxID=1520807 RepID=UPI0008813E12|nr:helix-turn-helix transcriptional regulator [Butyrivibrio sp. INlla16]SDB51534.1 transcriptional regulator, XRE family [Butyrivibrio sp. INlla16]
MTFKEYKEKALKDSEIKMIYDSMQPEYNLLEQLVTARKELGMTQKELAEKANLKQSNISRFENGGVSPTFEFAEKIARALGFTIQYQLKPMK